MSWTVSIEGGAVIFHEANSGKTIAKPLGWCTASNEGDTIVIANMQQGGNEVVRASYIDFTSPTASSAAALRTTLNTNFLFSSSGTTGSTSQSVEVVGPTTAFNELSVATNSPEIQADFVYHANGQVFEEFTNGTGSISTADGKVSCQTGAGVGGYGLIRTKKPVVYRPGQGVLARFTAGFTAGIANSAQRAGMIQAENELSFGYNNATFGILRRTGAALEIQTLTLSAAAGGAETATVTLNGTVFNPALTGLGTTQGDAKELAAASYTGWTAHQLDNTVIFISSAAGNLGGAFSYSSTGTSAGTFAETRAGADPTDTFTAQANWNIDPMDGTGPSGMTLNQANLNVYEIELQYLGAGNIRFKIEDSETGKPQAVHQIKYANSSTDVSVRNPSFKLGWFAASLGSTSNLTTIGASCAGFIQGEDSPQGPDWSAQNSKSGITTTITNILTLKVAPLFQAILNNSVAKFIDVEASSAFSGNNTGAVLVYIDATLGGTPNFQELDSDSFMWQDTAGTTVSGGRLIRTIPLGKNDSATIPLKDIGTTLARSQTITIAGVANSGTGEFEVSATWKELV